MRGDVAVAAAHLDGVGDVEPRALGVADIQALARAAGVQQVAQLLVVDLQQLHPNAVLRLQPTHSIVNICSLCASHDTKINPMLRVRL